MIPNTSGIYLINCVANGRIYIGSASRLRYRWENHRRDLRRQKHNNRHLQSAWDKYGKEAFVFMVLEECPKDVLLKREQHYLDTWNPFKPHGFNMSPTAGSNLGIKISIQGRINIGKASKGRKLPPETRAKMKIAAKERMAKRKAENKGFPSLSEETRKKISAATKGKKRTPEQRARMSAGMKGREFSPETKAKLAAANRGRKMTSEQYEKHMAIIASPEYREKLKTAMNSPEVRTKMKAAMNSPEIREKISLSHKGKVHSPETRAKISASLRKPKAQEKLRMGRKGYIYIVTTPEGEEIETTNLNEFCEKHNLLMKGLHKVIQGGCSHYKGYKARRKDLETTLLTGELLNEAVAKALNSDTILDYATDLNLVFQVIGDRLDFKIENFAGNRVTLRADGKIQEVKWSQIPSILLNYWLKNRI